MCQSQTVPCQSLDTLHAASCAPLQNQGAAGTCHRLASPAGLPAPHPEPAPLARGLGNKGLKKSDNFSPQLDLIFFFDAPAAGGRI